MDASFLDSSRSHEGWWVYSIHSVAEMRRKRGMSWGMTARVALMMSVSRRARFSREPPEASVRWLEMGDKNSEMRYPWAPWISMVSTPAWTARLAASWKLWTSD